MAGPSRWERFWERKAKDAKNKADQYNHYESIKQNGILDPLITYFNGKLFVVEPGQTRWCILKSLGVEYAFYMAKVEQNELQLFNKQFRGIERKEIFTLEEASKYFNHTKISDHQGAGYLRRRWFKENV